MGNVKTDWRHKWLDTAAHFGTFSKDPAVKVGAIAVKDNRVVSTGWNGFPRGFPDRPEDFADRAFKDDNVVHAEKNCVYNAAREGVSLVGTTVYVHGMLVCNQCALGLVQAGVKQVIMQAPPPEKIRQRWLDEFAKTRYTFERCWVDYGVYDKVTASLSDHRYEPRQDADYAPDPRPFRPGASVPVDV